MPSITSSRVNYLVWRYLREEGLALSGYTLDKETLAGHWDAEYKDRTEDGELVKLILKGLQMLEIEQVHDSTAALATKEGASNLERMKTLKGGYSAVVPFAVLPTHLQILLVASTEGVAAYALPDCTEIGSGAFTINEAPTCLELHGLQSAVFVGYETGALRGWSFQNSNVELQSVLMLPDAERAPIVAIKRAPSGRLLASIDVRNIVAIWDTASRSLVSRTDVGASNKGFLTDAVWITDTMLAVLHPDSVAVHTVGEDTPRRSFRVPQASQLAFDNVSRLLASGSDDGQVCLWSSHTEEPYRVIRDHHGPITHVSWVSDSPISQPRLVTASTDGWIKLWTLEEPAAVTSAHVGDPIYLVHPAPSYIAVVTKRGVKLYSKALVGIAEFVMDGVQAVSIVGQTLIVAAKGETSIFAISAAA